MSSCQGHVGDIPPDNPRDNPTDKSGTTTEHVERYKRAFQRALRRRPTHIQRGLMENAAAAQVKYDQALLDPRTGAQNLAHLERVARKAGNAMWASFPIRPEPEPNKRSPTLSDTLASAR
jgi:hypothetical protein